MSWPLLRQSKPGFVSQFGALEGMDDLETPRRMEAVPYVVTKNATEIDQQSFASKSRVSMGGDVKYRIAPNVTLDATINPGLRPGRIRSGGAQPHGVRVVLRRAAAVLRRRSRTVPLRRQLQRRELQRRRACTTAAASAARRQLAGIYGDTVPLQPTTILGAGKLIGRFPRGLTVGVLDAVTQRESSPGDTTFEPRDELHRRARDPGLAQGEQQRSARWSRR